MSEQTHTPIDRNQMKPDPAVDGVVIESQHQAQQTSNKNVFIESYGCQMNFADSEVVASILAQEGYQTTSVLQEADLVLLNTCSIREKAEQTVRNRLDHFNALKRTNKSVKVGVLGCMAERLKHKFL